MELHWLRATALKTPMSAYLTLMLCANSTSLHRRRVSKVAYPVETHGLYHEVHKSLEPTETDESNPVQASLGPKSDVCVHGRNITYVRIDFCRLIPGTYVSGT